MKNKHKPDIRFPGYTGDWDQRKLDSIVERVKSYSLSRDVETSEYTGYKYIHYGDIHTKVADIIDESSNLPNIKAGNYEPLEKGDLVLADASEDYQGIATPAVITIDVPYKLVAGLHTIALRPKQVDSLFLYYLINSSTFRKYGYKTGTGMKVFGISVTNLLEFEGMFPSIEEQTKIGNFFKQLDETITLHQQELTTLKKTKQGFLQKMFPKEGESVPKVRFLGFTGDWEEKKLNQVAEYRNGKAHEKNISDNGKYIVINSKFVSTNGKVKKFSDEQIEPIYENEIAFVLSDVPNGRAIAKTFLVKTNDTYSLNQRIAGITPGRNTDPYFLYTLMNRHHYFLRFDDGVGQTNLSKKDVEGFIENYPSLEEQQKIGKFFKQLDDTIDLHQRELEVLIETKKAFMQKMLV